MELKNRGEDDCLVPPCKVACTQKFEAPFGYYTLDSYLHLL